MAEQQTAETQGETPATEQATETPPEDVTGLKSALEKERESRKAAEKAAKENSDAAKRLQEIEDANKSDLEKLSTRAETAEAKLGQTEAEATRLRVAVTKGVPPDLIDRLKGDTQEEIEADADKLLELVADRSAAPQPAPRPDLSQGGSGTSSATDDRRTFVRELTSRG